MTIVRRIAAAALLATLGLGGAAMTAAPANADTTWGTRTMAGDTTWGTRDTTWGTRDTTWGTRDTTWGT